MDLRTRYLQWRLMIAIVLAVIVPRAHGQDPAPETDYFDPLKDLDAPAPHGVANQNFTICCLRALNDWRKNPNNPDPNKPDIIVQSSKSPFNVFNTADDLRKNGAKEQFPCGAEYDDKEEGATRVKISYTWCKSNCGGWQRSRSAVLEQWVQPFVGFILPAAVFCLNVPRKNVINISDRLFMNLTKAITKNWGTFTDTLRATEGRFTTGSLPDLSVFFLHSAGTLLGFLIGALIAALIGFANVVVWVLVVFSTAAPMILSGLYEATIDRQVLRAIEKDMSGSKKPKGQTEKDHSSRLTYHIHLLYAVLVGNLVLRKTATSAPTQDTDPIQSTPAFSCWSRCFRQQARNDLDINSERAWVDIEALVEDLDPVVETSKAKTKTRLKSMLQCQASFGATIGAPVAFYLGSFLFSVFGNHAKLGDSDVSLTLAFGEWWMTIPHVAIVSGCLLAGNNPYTLETIVSGIGKKDSPDQPERSERLWTPFYKSVYQPVWMWERGRNKRNWFKRVKKDHVKKAAEASSATTPKKTWSNRLNDSWKEHLTTPDLESVPTVRSPQWIFLLLTASVLIVIPFVLAYVTSFYTPTIGLSCRTFTFVLYFVFQSLLTMLWGYDFWGYNDAYEVRPDWFYLLLFLFFGGSAFTAIIGTFMQILGVYRNCLCNIPMGSWGSKDFHFTVSTNSAEGIYYASRYWLSTGIASMCVLVIFCYFGWWYQRHWRMQFNNVVDQILKELEQPQVGENPDKPAADEPSKSKGIKKMLGGSSKPSKSGTDKTTQGVGKKGAIQDQNAELPQKTPVVETVVEVNPRPGTGSRAPTPAPSIGKPAQKDDLAIEKARE
ncbi:hypothetical protein K458DRAFT_123851 [Lentithecium fluviatile CBS 122367]|uniref:Uncharacterized protein n=1 Tax=Lentithecium fluviatile CBS 122367 TaxID=1168545 RepID=A0A6G1JG37_9PLEO|nr:hypothetical protein K458DRAFT_123851 [Lentithecium fluviatile CBS 122367]